MEERVRSEVVVLLLVVLVAEAVCVADQRKVISAFGRHGVPPPMNDFLSRWFEIPKKAIPENRIKFRE